MKSANKLHHSLKQINSSLHAIGATRTKTWYSFSTTNDNVDIDTKQEIFWDYNYLLVVPKSHRIIKNNSTHEAKNNIVYVYTMNIVIIFSRLKANTIIRCFCWQCASIRCVHYYLANFSGFSAMKSTKEPLISSKNWSRVKRCLFHYYFACWLLQK